MQFETMIFSEEEAGIPFRGMAEHNERLLEEISKPGFDGSTALDPTLNGAQPLLHLAAEIIASYPQGAFSRPEADRYVETTLLLLKAISRRYGRNIAKPMQLAFMANFNLWHNVAAKTHPAEKYVKAIFDSDQTLFDAICNSNFLISTLKENAPGDKGKRRNPRKGSGLKGRRTKAMANWLDRFEEYVKTGNPIDEKYKEKTVGARANQFWNNNRQSLEAAKNAEGESRGFSSPKTLADAYRKR